MREFVDNSHSDRYAQVENSCCVWLLLTFLFSGGEGGETKDHCVTDIGFVLAAGRGQGGVVNKRERQGILEASLRCLDEFRLGSVRYIVAFHIERKKKRKPGSIQVFFAVRLGWEKKHACKNHSNVNFVEYNKNGWVMLFFRWFFT